MKDAKRWTKLEVQERQSGSWKERPVEEVEGAIALGIRRLTAMEGTLNRQAAGADEPSDGGGACLG